MKMEWIRHISVTQESKSPDSADLRWKDPEERHLKLSSLQVIHSEVDRRRDAHSKAVNSMQTRAAILIAAAGAFGGWQGAEADSGWLHIPVALAVAAAVLGIIALGPLRGLDIDAKKLFALRKLPSHELEFAIVRDNIKALDDDQLSLDKNAKIVRAGLTVLAFAWLITLTITAISFY